MESLRRGLRIEEAFATKEVLESKGFTITDEMADRVLDTEINLDSDFYPEISDGLELYPITDGKFELSIIMRKIKSGEIVGNQRDWILSLMNKEVLNKLVSGKERNWISSDTINEVFSCKEREEPKGHLAWYLSQPPGSAYYCGEWFEKRGKFLRSPEGELKISSSGILKFRPKDYRISKPAVLIIKEELEWTTEFLPQEQQGQ